jgi:hypothetical protein
MKLLETKFSSQAELFDCKQNVRWRHAAPWPSAAARMRSGACRWHARRCMRPRRTSGFRAAMRKTCRCAYGTPQPSLRRRCGPPDLVSLVFSRVSGLARMPDEAVVVPEELSAEMRRGVGRDFCAHVALRVRGDAWRCRGVTVSAEFLAAAECRPAQVIARSPHEVNPCSAETSLQQHKLLKSHNKNCHQPGCGGSRRFQLALARGCCRTP